MAVFLNGPKHDRPDSAGENILRSHLNHAWTVRFLRRQERAKVQVVCKDNQMILGCIREDLRIRSRRLTDFRPMDGPDSVRDKELDPHTALKPGPRSNATAGGEGIAASSWHSRQSCLAGRRLSSTLVLFGAAAWQVTHSSLSAR